MTCLFVVSIIGMFCHMAAPPVAASCVYEGGHNLCYIEEPEALPLWASWYDPTPDPDLPDEQNINCNDDCSNVATGPVESWMFGAAAACPIGWNRETRLQIPWTGGWWECVDHGPRIRPMYRPVYGPEGFSYRWAIVIDFMEYRPGPPWKYVLIEAGDWRRQ